MEGFQRDTELVEALWSRSDLCCYATGGEVAATHSMPTSIHVDGVGDLALPLSHDDFLKLKAVSTQARDEQNLLWQVDASKLSCLQIPDFFAKVAVDLGREAIIELGIDADALGLEVKLEKLLAYEQGGQFEFQRDTKKKIATMILQLPTQSGHEGGQLEIRHGKKLLTTYDFSGIRSTITYFKTVFFSDCKPKLAEVMNGNKLCLEFSLENNNIVKFDMAMDVTSYIFNLGKVQKFLREWAESGTTLAIPLGHKYSNNSLSFASLKGYDKVVATLVLSCTDFLDVHLCMLVKEVDFKDSESDHEKWRLENWSTVGGIVRQFTSSSFNKEAIVQYEDLFKEPHSRSYAAVLVVWPKEKRMKALTNLQPVKNVVGFLEEQHEQDPEKTSGDVQSLIAALTNKKDFSSDLLLEFYLKHDLQDAAFVVMKQAPFEMLSLSWAVFIAIQKYGWDACYKEVIKEALESHLLEEYCGCFAPEFPKRLRESGFEEAAIYVARKLSNIQGMLHSVVVELVEFFCISKLEEETWHTWSKLSNTNDWDCMALVAKTWGKKSIPHIEELLEKRLIEGARFWKNDDYSGHYGSVVYYSLDKLERNGKRRFLREVAGLVLKLWDQGCGDVALSLGKKKNWMGVTPEEYGEHLVRSSRKLEGTNF